MPTDSSVDGTAPDGRDDMPGAETAGDQHPSPSYVALGDAVNRALGARTWWPRRRSRQHAARPVSPTLPPLTPPGGSRVLLPAAAALGAVLVLSMVWVTTLRDTSLSPTSDGGSGALETTQHGSAPAAPPSASGQGRIAAAEEDETSGARIWNGPSCPRPLAVTASPDIAPLIQAVAPSLASGGCIAITVTAEAPDETLSTMAAGDGAPDVWIPASTLSLRMATTGDGQQLPTTGTSIATSPIMVGLPAPVHDSIAGPLTLPAWRMLYRAVVEGDIERMSMPDPESTVGALALISMQQAMVDGYDEQAFLRTLHFRANLASTTADVKVLLDRLGRSSPERAATEVGVFPATEQQLLAFNDRNPPVPVYVMGTYDAMTEADFPLAVSDSLDIRLDRLAGDLLAELRSPRTIERLVDAGFRPPRDATTRPSALDDTNRFQSRLPEPLALPSANAWRDMLDAWRSSY